MNLGLKDVESLKRFIFIFFIRDIWKVYLDSNEFKIAKEYCDKSNPADLDVINCKEAEHLFNERRYIEAAEVRREERLR